MMVTNTVGAALFMRILRIKGDVLKNTPRLFCHRAESGGTSTRILRQGFNEENSMKVAQVAIQELDIGAVAITDRERLLAFTGIGDDHHLQVSRSIILRKGRLLPAKWGLCRRQRGAVPAVQFTPDANWARHRSVSLRGESTGWHH